MVSLGSSTSMMLFSRASMRISIASLVGIRGNGLPAGGHRRGAAAGRQSACRRRSRCRTRSRGTGSRPHRRLERHGEDRTVGCRRRRPGWRRPEIGAKRVAHRAVARMVKAAFGGLARSAAAPLSSGRIPARRSVPAAQRSPRMPRTGLPPRPEERRAAAPVETSASVSCPHLNCMTPPGADHPYDCRYLWVALLLPFAASRSAIPV